MAVAPVMQRPPGSLKDLYLHWVDAWRRAPTIDDDEPIQALGIAQIASFLGEFKVEEEINTKRLRHVVESFRWRLKHGEVIIGGQQPPSCMETNLLSEQYNPETDCRCNGISSFSDIKEAGLDAAAGCHAIARMMQAQKDVSERPDEWTGHGIFTTEKLERAVKEMTLCNMDIQQNLSICSGQDFSYLGPIAARDRRPSPDCDTPADEHNTLFPTIEEVKLCTDAKHLFSVACGATMVDQGISRAIADTGNDVLIGDYCEAATPRVLESLQKTGAAAFAFLKLCNLAGILDDWSIEILAAAHLHFRVLGYYRNHAVSVLPQGLYGSRMTELTAHRHIDIAITVGIVTASLATGQRINAAAYNELSHSLTLINDLVDFRSDAMRNQRENPVLRGIRGCLCDYLKSRLLSCISCATTLIQSKQMLAMVGMSFCNWAIMASHHKLYEVMRDTRRDNELALCSYDGLEEQYHRLLSALEPYGTLGSSGPSWDKKRKDLDRLYSLHRESPASHLAWLADATRLLLQPVSFRRLVDVVHYPWTGDTGQADYCP